MLKIFVFLSFILMKPIMAQWAVVDGPAMTQNLLNYAKMAEQVLQDAEYMKNQVKSLESLGWKDPYALQRHLDFFNSLKGRADTLTYNYKNLDSNFRRLYSTKDKPIDKKLDDWSKQTETSIQASMKSHGSIQESNKKMETVSNLIDKQRSAQGDLAAIQVLGELIAIQSRQLEELKTIIALDSRAKQSRMMEDKSIEKARAEQSRHLMKDFKKPMKAKRPMKKFPSLGTGVY